MNRLHYLILNLFVLFICSNAFSQREIISIDSGWQFKLQDKENTQHSNPDIEIASWQKVDIPHDWAHEGGISRDGAQAANGGYYDGGIGWYQTVIDAPKSWMSKKVLIEFDGVYMNSEVMINGRYLGKRPYGYISFRYNLSEHLKPGENTIEVRVDNSLEPSARWYHPCGIYAPVRLIVTENQCIAPNGLYITASNITSEKADMKIKATLLNASSEKVKAVLETTVIAPSGETLKIDRAPFTWKADAEKKIEQKIEIADPELWSPESPSLYQVVCKILIKDEVVDELITNYGIRHIEWKTETGFWLNGKQTKLLGVCEHYEGGPVGGAWTKSLLRWKLELFKKMGVNAIRTAHNPYPPMFYDLCDEMGFLVMDEIFDGWKRKAPQDYGKQAFNEWWEKDLTEWIERDRNHPSIVIYSLGNETGGEIGKDLVAKCHELDPTRPVTSGHSASNFMDVYGVNGGSEKQGFYKKSRPQKPFVATEAPHTWQTRGYYRTQTWYRDGYPNKNQQPFFVPDLTESEIFQYEWASPDKWVNGKQHFNSSYDNGTLRITARKNWEIMRDSAWFSGHFRWTGFDYYGEAGYVHGGWPFRLFMSGAIDVAGFEKDLFYFYQSQWSKEPMVHILPHWTHPMIEEGTEIPVWVYSNCDEVELFLNGKSLGIDKPGTKWDEMQCEWLVPYATGTLLAKGFIDGKEVVHTSQTTANNPAKIVLNLADISDDNLSRIVTVAITDNQENLYPYGENKIYFNVEGPARLLALENGDPVDTTKNVGVDNKKAFMGLARAFYQLENVDESSVLVAGGIIGEKQLKSSNKVSIDVQSIALNGMFSSSSYQIYYTTDGSRPTSNSRLYKNPFTVELGTLVKAIVVKNGRTILNMEEKFDKDLGLCWDKSNDNTAQLVSGMRAVDADFSKASIRTNNKTKYLDFKGGEGKIIWYQENDGSAGLFTLTIHYASNDKKSKRPMDLIINNKKVATLNFESTNSWSSNWKQVITKQQLQAGANYIELHSIGESAPNVLLLEVE